jgi:hypothetical protein
MNWQIQDERELRQCPDCKVFTSNDDHTCLVYSGPPCTTCGEPTVDAFIGAPGYGKVRTCRLGHVIPLTRCGILDPRDVI